MTQVRVLEAIFWLSAAWLAWVHLGYGLLVWLRRLVKDGKPSPAPATPVAVPLSIIVAVHDGAEVIGDRIADCLRQERGAGVEVVVASDGSTDETEELVRRIQDPRVRLVASPRREGKEAAQRRAIEAADGEILVFTDAAVSFEPGALECLAAGFADPEVGCVSGVDRLAGTGGEAAGESAFVRYDTWLKVQESLGGSTVGNSGWLFAVRRRLCADWPVDLPSDFTMALRAVRAGLRAIVEPSAVVSGGAVPGERDELRRKVRTIVRGMAALAAYRDLLDPFRHGFFALQLWSHKVLRWLSPLPMAGLLAAAGGLAFESRFFAAAFGAQAAFWGLAVLVPRIQLPRYLALTTAAAVLAAWQYARGERYVVWQPSARRLNGVEP